MIGKKVKFHATSDNKEVGVVIDRIQMQVARPATNQTSFNDRPRELVSGYMIDVMGKLYKVPYFSIISIVNDPLKG